MRHSPGGVPACSHHREKPWFATSALFLKSVRQSNVFPQSQLLNYLSIPVIPDGLCKRRPFPSLLLGCWQSTWRDRTATALFLSSSPGISCWLLLEQGHKTREVLGLSWGSGFSYQTGVCCSWTGSHSKSTNHSPGS